MTVAAALLIAGVGGGSTASYAAVRALDGGGTQPEDALPASSVAVAKIDTDPAFGQKRAIFQLSRKFPKSGAKTEASLKDDLLRSLFADSDVDFDLDYDRDIKPWVGQRAAIAVVPDANKRTGFTVVAAIQHRDTTKTRIALRRIVAAQSKQPGGQDFFFTFKKGYVLVSASQAEVDSYAASAQSLSDVAGYRESIAALGGDQIATAWVNVRATYLATPKAARKQNPLFASLKTMPTGYVVVGLHAASSYIEVLGKSVGTNADTNRAMYGGLGTSVGANLLGSYPADTWAGVDAVGLGDAVVDYYNASGLAKDRQVMAGAKQLGLTLPRDLKTLLGAETAVGVMGGGADIDVVGRILSSTPTLSAGLATTVVSNIARSRQQLSGLVRPSADGYYVGSSKAAVLKTATAKAKLGDTVSFKRALPEASTSGFSIYVNIQGALRATDADDEELRDARYLDAFGFTANPATSSFRLRLTVR